MFCAAKLQRKSEYTKFSPYFFYYSNNANKDIISIRPLNTHVSIFFEKSIIKDSTMHEKRLLKHQEKSV